MGVYTIKDSQTGRTLKVQGDAPPSPQDMAEIFAGVGKKLAVGRANSSDPSAREAEKIVAGYQNPGLAIQSKIGQALPDARAISGSKIYRGMSGVADMGVGAAQLLSNVTGIGDETMNNFVNKREDMIRQGREYTGSEGIDWTRFAGNMAASIPMGGAGLAKGATVGAKVGYGAGMGAGFGAIQPTEGDSRSDVLKSKAIASTLSAIVGGALPLGVEGVKFVGQKGASLLNLSPEAAQMKLGQILNELSGPKKAEVIKFLRLNGGDDLMGPNVGLASTEAGAPGIAAFDDLIAKNQGVRLDEREALNQARTQLMDFAGDKSQLELAKELRSQIPKTFLDEPSYLTTDVLDILGRNNVKDVIPAASKLLDDQVGGKVAGRINPSTLMPENPNTNSRMLQNVKLALDAKLSGKPDSNLDKIAYGEVLASKDKLTQWMSKNIPGYEDFRSAYSSQSVPIDRMTIAQGLRQKLEGAMSNYSDDAVGNKVDDLMPDILRQRANTFETAIQNEASTIKTASGRQVYKTLADIFAPNEMANIKRVSDSLTRDARLAELAREGRTLLGSEFDSLEAPQIKNMLERTVTLGNQFLKTLGDKQIRTIEDLYKTIRTDPKKVADIMENAGQYRPDLSKFISIMDTIGSNGKYASAIQAQYVNEATE